MIIFNRGRHLMGVVVVAGAVMTGCSDSNDPNERDATQDVEATETVDGSRRNGEASLDDAKIIENAGQSEDTVEDAALSDVTPKSEQDGNSDSAEETVSNRASTDAESDKAEKNEGQDSTSDSAAAISAITGAVQKGPFILGTSIRLQELDNTLVPTGRVFIFETVDDLGRFNIPSYVSSTYVEIIASGYYYDEISGELSTNQLTLRTISDLSTSNIINVNLLTSLAASRERALVANGMSFNDARDQAESEVLDALEFSLGSDTAFDQMDVSLSGEANALLLAASISFEMLAYLRDPGSPVAALSQLLSSISMDIGADGTFDNAAISAALRCIVPFRLNAGFIRAAMQKYYESLGVEITPPEFEPFLVAPESCCEPDMQRCSEDTIQTCDENGRWQDTTACEVDRPFCKDAYCAAPCTSGESRCGGRTAQTCDADGRWQDGGTCVWGTPVEVATEDGPMDFDQGVDASGNVIVVWMFNRQIKAIRFIPEVGWCAPEIISPIDAESPSVPSLSVAASGDAVAVWTDAEGVIASRYHPGTGWEGAEPILSDEVESIHVEVVYAGDTPIVVYASSNTLRSIRYHPESGWTPPESIAAETSELRVGTLRLTGNSAGYAIAGWAELHDYYSIFAARYTLESGWEEPSIIADKLFIADFSEGTGLEVAIESGGNAIAIWNVPSQICTPQSTVCGIWTSNYLVGAGWGGAERLWIGFAPDMTNLSLAVDSDGNAFAVWMNYDLPNSEYSKIDTYIRASRYLNRHRWTEAEPTTAVMEETDIAGPRIVIDANGYATVVFRASTQSAAEISVSRYINQVGWETEIVFLEPGCDWNSAPELVVDPRGRVTVFCRIRHSDPPYRYAIFALRFD
ncbi:MAG: hypothetical protein JXA30_09000 [Deltaproteobacteria bacterium]|nr:hypothetical protein [Deltaproteobacteria bacterium]